MPRDLHTFVLLQVFTMLPYEINVNIRMAFASHSRDTRIRINTNATLNVCMLFLWTLYECVLLNANIVNFSCFLMNMVTFSNTHKPLAIFTTKLASRGIELFILLILIFRSFISVFTQYIDSNTSANIVCLLTVIHNIDIIFEQFCPHRFASTHFRPNQPK